MKRNNKRTRRTILEVEKEIRDKDNQQKYLYDFLSTLHKGENIKHKVEKELICLDRELSLLRWFIIDDELPF